MITLLGNAPASDKYVQGTFLEFSLWLEKQRFYQFDIETNVTESWIDKKLISMQFGNLDGTETWFLQWSSLTEWQKDYLKEQLEREDTTKLIHNAMFEATVLLGYDIWIESVYDTMLAEQVLDAGQSPKPPSLAELVEKYLYKTLDKTEQTNFGDDLLTESKIVYGVTDVMYLGAIMRMQIPFLQQMDLDWIAALENEVVLSYAEMTFNGFPFDKAKWLENLSLAQPLIDEAQKKLESWLVQEPFYHVALEKGYISNQDQLLVKWTSPQQRGTMLKMIFPDVLGASVGVVTKYLKTHPTHEDKRLLEDFLAKDYTLLEQVLLQFKKDELIKEGWLILAGQTTINWNSPDQVLPLFKTIAPRLKSTSEKDLAKVDHEIVQDLHDYKDGLKLTTTYGEEYIEKHVDKDGRIHATINQIVSTGRVSYRRPNLQQIPVEKTGPRYRECFVAPPGWKVVGADMSSQELVIIATLSQDPVWLKSLRDGEDLHSTTSELLYGQKWVDAALPDCKYYHDGHQKCKCPEHEHMRYKIKRVNYGLA